jgi:hypothetical protein
MISLVDLGGDARRLESSITGLKGVRRARVEIDEGGIVNAVRVLVIPERETRDLMVEIEALIRQNGATVAPGSIQILRTTEVVSTPLQRRKLSSIATERTSTVFKARVILELDGDTLMGESETPSERSFEYRSIALATLESMNELLVDRVELESVDLLQAGAEQLAIVTLRRKEGTLVGSALVRVDRHDAIARATLDALNRHLSAPRRQTRANRSHI